MKVDNYDGPTKVSIAEVSSTNDDDEESSVVPSETETSLAVIESLTMPLVQEVVISADIRCIECQKRISNVISRFNAETESVVVNLSEKKVIITCNYLKSPGRTQITTSRRNVFSKMALIKRMFGSSKP